MAWTTMTLLALGVAVYTLINLISPKLRPRFVQKLFTTAPTAISVHLGGGLVAIALGAFQVDSRLRTQFLPVHRWLGRLYVLAVLTGGIAGFILALNSFGGLVTHFGFGLMAVCWVETTLNALRHILNGNVVEHRAWMLRRYAVTSAGVTLRIYLKLSTALGVEFETACPVLSWLCWVPNLLIVERFVRSKPSILARA